MADLDPIDKGKVNEVVFDLLDHLDEWYGPGAEIGHLLVVPRATDAGGGRSAGEAGRGTAGEPSGRPGGRRGREKGAGPCVGTR